MNVYITEKDGKKRVAVELSCDECHLPFLKRKSFVAEKNYCSRQCAKSAQVTSCEYKCDLCSELFTRKPSALAKSKSGLLFCTRKCKDEAQRIENNFTEMHPPHYGQFSSNRYRDTAYAVFPKVCMACGWCKYKKLMEVHHLDSDRSNNDISNLAVLCPICHRAITLGYAVMDSDRIWKWIG